MPAEETKKNGMNDSRDRRDYYRRRAKEKYDHDPELCILRRLHLYYLARGTTPKPWTRLSVWCEQNGLGAE